MNVDTIHLFRSARQRHCRAIQRAVEAVSDWMREFELSGCFQIPTHNEDDARVTAFFVPRIFDFGQWHSFGFDFQFARNHGVEHAADRVDQALKGDASNAAAHQDQRGRAQGGAGQ